MFQFVVARYNEDILWTNMFSNVIVYNKGINNISNTNVIYLPNVGREGHTYFTHIYDNYDKLAEFTVFLQGNPFDHSPRLFAHIAQILATPKDALYTLPILVLSEYILSYSFSGCPEKPGLPLKEVFQYLFPQEKVPDSTEIFYFGAGAQFILSKVQIHSRARDFYRSIVDLLQKENNPIEGHVIERFHASFIFSNRGVSLRGAENVVKPFLLEKLPNQKIALCFILNYSHTLHKEKIWRKWLESHADFFNIYFFYKDAKMIQSPWIRKHALPLRFIVQTSYFHIVPAYISLMAAATRLDRRNQWFCFLTDTCSPIRSCAYFLSLFHAHTEKSIFQWGNCNWNVQFHSRANLRQLPTTFHLSNDPWFILSRTHVFDCLHFCRTRRAMFEQICRGGLANESIFAIILLKLYKREKEIIHASSHITDWTRMSSATSPYVFEKGSSEEIAYIQEARKKNPYAIFLRKVATRFPDSFLLSCIC